MPSTIDATNAVPEMIEEEYQRLGITQAEFARRVGVRQSAIAAIVKRQKALGPELARRLAPHLHLTQVEMFQLAGMITEHSDAYSETRALQRIRSMFAVADEGTQNEIADIAETVVNSRRKSKRAR